MTAPLPFERKVRAVVEEVSGSSVYIVDTWKRSGKEWSDSLGFQAQEV